MPCGPVPAAVRRLTRRVSCVVSVITWPLPGGFGASLPRPGTPSSGTGCAIVCPVPPDARPGTGVPWWGRTGRARGHRSCTWEPWPPLRNSKPAPAPRSPCRTRAANRSRSRTSAARRSSSTSTRRTTPRAAPKRPASSTTTCPPSQEGQGGGGRHLRGSAGDTPGVPEQVRPQVPAAHRRGPQGRHRIRGLGREDPLRKEVGRGHPVDLPDRTRPARSTGPGTT